MFHVSVLQRLLTRLFLSSVT